MISYCLVEPALAAVPPVVDEPRTIEAWLGTLLELGNISRSELGRYLLKSASLDDALLNGGRLPNFKSVQTMLTSNGLDEVYSTSDILRTALMLLTRLPTIEQLPADEVAIEILSLKPSLYSTSDAHLNSCLTRMLETVCCCRESQAPLGAAIATLPGIAGPLIVTGQLLRKGGAPPFTPYSQSIPLVKSWSEFLRTVDFEELWHRAADTTDLRLALEAACAARNWTFFPFTFGNHFVNSLKYNAAWGYHPFSGSVLWTCLDIVSGQDPGHPFRVAGKWDAPQMSRANYFAWRAHVTKGGPALRLMYWKSPSEIEFSRLGPKNELRID
jgi:hypothetical protein